jgi:hypothetical protein
MAIRQEALRVDHQLAVTPLSHNSLHNLGGFTL